MRRTHTCPRSRMLATRRQLVRGMGALLGGTLTGCAGAGSSGSPLPGGQAGSAAGLAGGAGMGFGGSAAGRAGAGGAGSAGLGGSAGAGPARKNAADRVILGMTGIEVSRLAMGSGTHGSGGTSDQTRLGTGFSNLLTYAFSQGVTFYETADAYGAHPRVAEAIRQVGRQNVVLLTKTTAQSAAGVEADLARFRRELGVDTIDIVLLHNKTSRSWTTECEGAMEALARAKQSGAIRAHGVSCHSLQALELAAQTPWVEVDLARINPAGLIMDSDPATVISVLTRMKAAGKGVLGMKILGEGQLANQLETAIDHAVALDCIDGFTIGFTSNGQLDQVSQRISASQPA
jgi:aryl-alcohol dehydrogenase-like predicted oxidoreductase